jgi:hypothetical protein
MAAPRDDEQLVDAYVDALLARGDAEALGYVAARPQAPTLRDPRLASVVTELHTSLVRFHPSFRFEDRVASRLRALAEGRRWVAPNAGPTAGTMLAPPPTRATATLIRFPTTTGTRSPNATEDPDHPRALLLGGAIASGVSLAGAALFAWRWQRGGRPGRAGLPGLVGRRAVNDHSLARAARAAHRLGGAGGRSSVIVTARLSGRLAARRQRQGLA